ncbi:hypothetical protein QMX33_001944 [Yersinia ruckeri]|nr:hypothetical protein [Yersinia ruckeri]ELV7520798.1 hypothetical protein [Yersinia ruckeri]
MPGQLAELTSGAIALLAALVWIAFLSARAVIHDHRSRIINKKETERKTYQQL